MVDDDAERSKLEAPKLFGRRRTPPAAIPPETDDPVFEDAGADTPDDTAVIPGLVEDTAPAAARRARRGRSVAVTEVADAPTRPRDRLVLPGQAAAALTGVATGLALVGFTSLGFRGCEALRGTSSCGQAPGMVALVLVFVLAVVVGRTVARWFGIPEPGPTSFLATGLTGVICLVALVEQLDHWSMVVVIPAITAVTFLFSWWVTTTYVDNDD